MTSTSVQSIAEIRKWIEQEHHFEHLLAVEGLKQEETLTKILFEIFLKTRRLSQYQYGFQTVSPSTYDKYIDFTEKSNDISTVYKSCSFLPCRISQTTLVREFLRHFTKYLSLILHDAVFYFTHFSSTDTVNDEIYQFSNSTFPALYGYCWCIEQTELCIDGLILMILKQLNLSDGPSDSAFRNSFVRYVCRQFYLMNDCSKYLQISIEPVYYKMARSPSDNDAQAILDCLIEKVQYLSPNIRRFFHEIYQEENSTQLILILFWDYMVKPALLNPKIFNIVLDEYVLLIGSHIVNVVSQLNTLFANGSAQLDHLVSQLTAPCQIQGISFSQIQSQMNVNYSLYLFSLADINLLSRVTKLIHGSETDPIRFFSSLMDYQDEPEYADCEFWYFDNNHSFKKESVIQHEEFTLPLFDEVTQPSIPKDELTSVTEHLISFLKNNPFSHSTATNLYDYMAQEIVYSYQTNSLNNCNIGLAITTKLRALDATEEEVMNRIVNILMAQLFRHQATLSSSFSYQLAYDLLITQRDKIDQQLSSLAPILHQACISLFVSKHGPETTLVDIQQLCTNRNIWEGTFHKIKEAFVSFVPYPAFCEPIVIRQLHSTLLKQVPLEKFLEYNSNTPQVDCMLAKHQHHVIALLIEKYSSPAQTAFYENEFYTAKSIDDINGLEYIGSPLEIFAQIRCIVIQLEKIFAFESNNEYSDDDFLPIIEYCFLKSRISRLFGLKVYIEYFVEGAFYSKFFIPRPVRRYYKLFSDCCENIMGLLSSVLDRIT